MDEKKYKEWELFNCDSIDTECKICKYNKECSDFGLTRAARNIIKAMKKEN
jgi:hypothetical protein